MEWVHFLLIAQDKERWRALVECGDKIYFMNCG